MNNTYLIRGTLLVGAAVLAFVIVALGTTTEQEKEPRLATIEIGDARLVVEVADTRSALTKGLSGRSEIGSDGLLMIFPEEERHGIWMKDMEFSLDIVWINEGEVVYVEEHVVPETYPAIFRPNSPARYVLEIPAGDAPRYGFVPGEEVVIEIDHDA